MSIIYCAECDGRVSTHALACPHCGAPFEIARGKRRITREAVPDNGRKRSLCPLCGKHEIWVRCSVCETHVCYECYDFVGGEKVCRDCGRDQEPGNASRKREGNGWEDFLASCLAGSRRLLKKGPPRGPQEAPETFWALGRQMVASIQMLRSAIEKCPDELWDERSEGTPFWHLAYHALYYCDFHLSQDEKTFRASHFHSDHCHLLPGEYDGLGERVSTPDWYYAKSQLLEYADHCIDKGRALFKDLTEERTREICGFWWYGLNVGEFLINNLRHTQHHAAQLVLILRRRADIGVEWLGTENTSHGPELRLLGSGFADSRTKVSGED